MPRSRLGLFPAYPFGLAGETLWSGANGERLVEPGDDWHVGSGVDVDDQPDVWRPGSGDVAADVEERSQRDGANEEVDIEGVRQRSKLARQGRQRWKGRERREAAMRKSRVLQLLFLLVFEATGSAMRRTLPSRV